MLESDAPEELLRISRVLYDETAAIHLLRELFDFPHHHPPDPLAPQLAGHDDVVYAHCIALDPQIRDGNDVAEELAEQTACRDRSGGQAILPVPVPVQERAHVIVIRAFDGAYEQS